MAVLTSYETGRDGDGHIGDNSDVEFQNAQSFKISSTANITGLTLYLAYNATASKPTDSITIRIETDNAGKPSGTLVNANATGTIPPTLILGTYSWIEFTFATPFSLSGNTTYHIRASVPNQATNVRYGWGRDESSPTYTNGYENYSINGGSSWTSETGMDLLFKVNGNISGSLFYSQL